MSASSRPPILDALILCSTNLEAWGLERALARRSRILGHRFGLHVGHLRDWHLGVLVFDTAAGRMLSQTAAALLSVHQPLAVIVGQFAVPLRPDLEAGAVVEAARVLPEQRELKILEVPTRVPGSATAVLSVRQWPLRQSVREALHERTGAEVAAWRAYTVIRAVCGHRGVEGAVYVTVVGGKEDLPAEALAVYGRGWSFRAGALCGAAIRGWSRVSLVRRLREEARRHSQRLRDAVSDRLSVLLARS